MKLEMACLQVDPFTLEQIVKNSMRVHMDAEQAIRLAIVAAAR
ncbi:hypothetical protein [Roseisolibacter agri]|nr:hypothetical protein [Roseisolibacter agri]